MFAVFLASIPCVLAVLIVGAVIANMVVLYREAKRGIHHS
jgi:hypothetical protein